MMASASGMLDIQSLPSLERFDSQLLDLFKQNYSDAGGAGVHVMDEMQAPDDDLALQRLMSLKDSQRKQQAAMAAAVLQHYDTNQPPPISHQQSHFLSHPHSQMAPQQQQQQQQHPSATVASMEAAQLAAQHLMSQAAAADAYMSQAQGNGVHPALAMQGMLGGALGGCDDPDSPMVINMVGDCGGMGGGGHTGGASGSKRRNRGSRMDDIVKLEQDGCEDGTADQGPEDSRTSTQSPSNNKRARSSGAPHHHINIDSDYEDHDAGAPSGGCHLSITPDMDEATRAKIRREKNRVAARKCRAKKMQFMVELQKTLRELMRKNEEYRLQVITWHKMFSREVRLREAMKRIIAVMWQSAASPAATGYTANDVIIGLESGTLDINSLIRSLAVLSSTQGLDTPSAAATLASPAPLVLGSPSAAAAAGALPPGTPRNLAAAANAGGLLALQMSDSAGDLAGLPGGTASDRVGPGVPNCGTPTAASLAAAAAAAGGSSSPMSPMMVPQGLLMQHSSIGVNCSSGLPASLSVTGQGLQQQSARLAPAPGGSGRLDGTLSESLAAPGGTTGVMGGMLGDIGGQGAAGAAAGGGGLEGTWLWSGGGLGGSGAGSVGPSCITTGIQD